MNKLISYLLFFIPFKLPWRWGGGQVPSIALNLPLPAPLRRPFRYRIHIKPQTVEIGLIRGPWAMETRHTRDDLGSRAMKT